jgi:hypothetical protein
MRKSDQHDGGRFSFPPDDPPYLTQQGDWDPDAVENSILQQLKQMSFEHRNTINEEIHGGKCKDLTSMFLRQLP